MYIIQKNKKSLAKKICDKIPNRFVVSYKNKNRRMWDLIPILLSFYNAVLLPFEMSFNDLSERKPSL